MNQKKLPNIALFLMVICNVQARTPVENRSDSILSGVLDEVVISASTKETNDLKRLPASISFVTPFEIENRKIITVKDLSMVVPNFYMPDYGSKLSAPVYIRGVGERSTGQSIGMYVDNMPVLDKSAFDFELQDAQQIEILRGPQGTLYGRNAMSGIINITTRSPLDAQYTRMGISAGNYGLIRYKWSIAAKASERLGFSFNLYDDRNNGYFTNDFTGKKADYLQAIGGSMRIDWKITSQWKAQLSISMDSCRQGAFPYGKYADGKIESPNQNFPGQYHRSLIRNNLNLQYVSKRVLFNANTGFQYLSDNMDMDNDYSSRAVFRLNQRQKEKSWTEELTLKSNTKENYQWLFGLFGFYSDLATNVITTMDTDGIATILQPAFDQIKINNPRAPQMTIKNREIPMPGTFQTPTYGGAIFHQSTYNNLFIKGLSITGGLRLDYEKPRLEYNTDMSMDLDVAVQAGPQVIHMDSTLVTALQGEKTMKFTELLPKIALKYEINPANYVYATVSSGYKTGGYNIQNFADIIQDTVRAKYDRTFRVPPIDSLVPYKPEYSWNYEVGFKGEIIKNRLSTAIAAYYTAIRDVQITGFVKSGQGRILKNAGKARSLGAEISLQALLTPEITCSLNYGFTDALFQNTEYAGNQIPFAPQNTLSVNGIYNKIIQNHWMDRFYVAAQYNGAGRIYWTEANDIYQNFYGMLNVRTGVNIGFVEIKLWANNVLNSKYAVFYFESMNQSLAQAGKPLSFGLDVNISF